MNISVGALAPAGAPPVAGPSTTRPQAIDGAQDSADAGPPRLDGAPAGDALVPMRPVYVVHVRQPQYAPHVAQAHWSQGRHSLGWALAAVPCGAIFASSIAAVSTISGAALAVGSALAVGIGCGTVVLAPMLVPFGIYLGICAAMTLAGGAMLSSSSLTMSIGWAAYEGAQATSHALLALCEEAGLKRPSDATP